MNGFGMFFALSSVKGWKYAINEIILLSETWEFSVCGIDYFLESISQIKILEKLS